MDEQERRFALLVSAESAIEVARGEGHDTTEMTSAFNVQKAIYLNADRERSIRESLGLPPSP